MHPLLNTHSLSCLPSAARRQAVKAVSGCSLSWDELSPKLEKLDEPALQKYLPVIYANLDPARIPDDSIIDTPFAFREGIPAVKTAYSSLRLLLKLERIPSGVAADLWPRAWAWMEFIEAYAAPVAAQLEDGTSEAQVLTSLLFILSFFGARYDAEQLVKSSPGVHTLIARCWTTLSMRPDGTWGCHSSDGLCLVIAYYYSDCDSVDCLIESFQSPTTFAHILSRHITEILDTPADAAGASKLNALAHIAKHLAESPAGARALATAGGAPLLTRALHLACTTFFESLEHENAIYDILSGLALVLSSRPFYPDVATAFESGLILAIKACGQSQRRRPLSTDALEQLKSLLSGILPAAMVYLPVVRALSKSIKQNVPIDCKGSTEAESELFRETALHAEYREFVQLIVARLGDYDKFRAGGNTELRGCDNHHCNSVHPTSSFKRCAQCVNAYYCSFACQKIAWRQTGHRKRCTPPSPYKQYPGTSLLKLKKRDERFIRHVVHQHYTRSSFDLLLSQLAFIKETRRTDFVMEFLYTVGNPIDVNITHLELRQPDGFNGWPDDAPPLSRCLVALDAGGGHGKNGDTIVRTYLLRRAPGVSEELARKMLKIAAEMKDGEDPRNERSKSHIKMKALCALDVVETIC
ncbi:hypothetical protein C8F01DRAFT_1147945 [Mycena amicta]|nr:hypothetical protein C8F01DRAFT_1147945 [Mycena amicta]